MQKNQAALQELLGTGRHPEWVATIAFYKAVHLVEAVLACDRSHSNSHKDRADRIKRNRHLNSIFSSYRMLMTASMVARYLSDNDGKDDACYEQFEDFIPLKEVETQLVNRYLAHIENVVQKVLQSYPQIA